MTANSQTVAQSALALWGRMASCAAVANRRCWTREAPLT